jgi:hypothetical protein
MNNDNRWSSWVGRARTCFRAATAIDAGTTAVTSLTRDLTTPETAELSTALRQAEAALTQARDAVQAALQARALTPANREVAYGLAG